MRKETNSFRILNTCSLEIELGRNVDLLADVFAVLFPLAHAFGQKILDLAVDGAEIVLCPGGDLRIASVTGKTPLKDVPTAITQELIIEKGHVYVLQTPLFRVRNKRTKIKNKQAVADAKFKEQLAQSVKQDDTSVVKMTQYKPNNLTYVSGNYCRRRDFYGSR